MFKRGIYTLLCILAGVQALKAQFYYGSQMEFGKNRVQYQDFNWTYFDFERYRVYLYEGGQEIARYVATAVNRQLPVMEKRLDFQAEDKIEILVYNNQNDFKQSNLGLVNEEQFNVGGVTRIVGDKISVFFNGSHADLDRQIRAGLAELLIDQMLYGGRARDMVRNSTLLVVPDWFKNGLVAYLSEGWNSKIDNSVMDAIQSNGYYRFNQLSGRQATEAGQALWYFVADNYGEAVIPNLLYMTKVSRNSDNAFLFVLGLSIQNVTTELFEAFHRRYMNFADSARVLPPADTPLFKRKKQRHYYQLKVSPDAQQVIWASSELGQVKVWYKPLDESKPKRLLKLFPKLERLEDFNYPLLAWHPNNSVVAMLYEHKNILVLHTYDIENKEHFTRNITGFEKVNSFSFSRDGKRIVMSAVKKGKGQSDIFIFTLNNGGVEQITNDVWDDNNPVFLRNSTEIAFESNRRGDTIRYTDDARYDYQFSRNNDIFLYHYSTKSPALLRITNTPDVNEVQAQEYPNGQIAYLSESNGIYNRYLARIDSSISFVDTTEHYRYFFKTVPLSNYPRNIVEQQVNTRFTRIAEIVYNEGQPLLRIVPLSPPDTTHTPILNPTWFKAAKRPAISDPEKIIMISPVRKEDAEPPNKNNGIDINHYTLSNEKPGDKTPEAAPANSTTVAAKDSSKTSTAPVRKEIGGLHFPIQQNYLTAFSMDYVVTQLDNSFLSPTYQKFTGANGPVYLNPGLNLMFKVGLSDLFEDYRIVGGFRISANLDNEFMLSWENRKHKIDRQLILHRQSFLKVGNYYGSTAKLFINDARYIWKLPFNEVASLRFSLSIRNDRTVYPSVSDQSLPKSDDYDNYGGAKIEYVFDNTRKRGINLYNGTRLKVFSEYQRLISTTRHDLISLGFDVRHYEKVHRDLIWASRLAGGTAWGTDRLIYYLGGVDSWFNPRFDNTINVVNPEQYQFQTLATNMRGFVQNIRNGNNFAVWNNELRWPVFRYFLNRPIRSDFVNNFQIIGFGDLGMAWYGTNPYSDDNVLNKNVYYNNPVTLTINSQKNPLVGGFGLGLRSRILGYFLRLDFAWGVDDKKVQKGITYFSMCTDF